MMLRLMDRLTGSFSIVRLVIASLFARLVTLFLLPSTPSFLAPDEGTYASLASWIADSKDAEGFPGFGPNLYNTSRTLILPTAALIRIGIGELTAIRSISIGFGILSTYLFAKIIFLTLRIKQLQDLETVRSQRLTLVGIGVFAFWPSSLIWSTLGLRESASMAMVLASVYFLIRLRDYGLLKKEARNLKSTLSIWVLGIVSISLAFGARRQTAIVFVVFFCISLALLSIRKNFFSITAVVLVGMAIGLLTSTTPVTRATTELVWTPIEQPAPIAGESRSPAPVAGESRSPAPIAGESRSPAPVAGESRSPAPVASAMAPSEGCDREGVVASTNSGNLVCSPRVIAKREISVNDVVAQAPIKNIDQLEYHREINRVGANTQIAETSCVSFTNLTYENLACTLSELPYRLVSILFRPLPFIDEGSLSNNLASAENILWIILFALFAHSLAISAKKRIKLYLVIPTAIYVLAFANLAALYEGNLGTAFRHKSTILWGLLLVVIVVRGANRADLKEVNQKS